MFSEVSFGPFTFSLVQRVLWCEGVVVALKPKESELLAILAERRPEIVPRDEILDKLWQGAASEAALNQTVYRLRQALRAHYAGKLIQTIPDIGFRLTGRSLVDLTRNDQCAFRPTFPMFQRAVALREAATEASLLQAIELLEAVIDKDPSYLPAHEMLAAALLNAGVRMLCSPQDAYWKGRIALQRVIDEEPGRGLAFATLSTLILYFTGNRDEAHAAAERALLLSPQSPAAHNAAVLERLSRREFGAALAQANIALAEGPSCAFTTALFGTVLYMSGRVAEAHQAFDTALTLNPYQHTAIIYKASAYALEEAYDRCEEQLARVIGADAAPRILALRGYVAGRRGNYCEAKALLNHLRAATMPTHMSASLVELGLNDEGAAATTLERALHTREPGLFLAAIDPLYGPLHAHFPQMMATIERGRSRKCERCGEELKVLRVRKLHKVDVCWDCRRYLSELNARFNPHRLPRQHFQTYFSPH